MKAQEITQELLLLKGFKPSKVFEDPGTQVLLTYTDSNASFQIRLDGTTTFSHNGVFLFGTYALDNLFYQSTGKRLDFRHCSEQKLLPGMRNDKHQPVVGLRVFERELAQRPQDWRP